MFDSHSHLPPHSPPPASPPPRNRNGRLLCGTTPDDWEATAAVAQWWPGSIPAFGLHPWFVGDVADQDWPEKLRQFLDAHPNAWVGEIGLDFLKGEGAARDRQLAACAEQLALAARYRRGVSLHCVKAEAALLELLDLHYAGGAAGVVIIHSFNGPYQAIAEFVNRGAYFSIGPLASRRDSAKIRGRVVRIPSDRLLLESDAFLAPGVDAEEDLLHTLRWLADLHAIRADDLLAEINATAQRIFSQ